MRKGDDDMKKLTTIKLKNSPEYNEAWLQKQIWEDPAILGLGDLHSIAKEKVLPYGRLDILLGDSDSDNPTRYEVEVQLGDTDASHIIRTIEYWDLERKRYPQYDHVAVLVAEEVTGRFLNVLNLFNGHIPLIVLKLEAFKVDGDVALHFTKILDRVQLGMPEDEEASEPANRAYWVKRSCPEMLKLTDSLLSIVKASEPNIVENYNKRYIGLLRNNTASNYCYFKPKKSYVYMICKANEEDEDFLTRLEAVGLDAEYVLKRNMLRIKIRTKPTAEQITLLGEAVERARKLYGEVDV